MRKEGREYINAMIKFYEPDMILKSINDEVTFKQSHATKRNGNSISLRPIVYSCIREVYFEVMDCPKVPTQESIDFFTSIFWTGPMGDTLHQKFQDLIGLSDQPWTEKLVTFKSFAPILMVRSKCDGIDLRDPDNIILWEIKTKEKIPSKPYDAELLQCLLSVFFFRREINLDIKGATMFYINRNKPFEFKFFNYDLFDPSSPNYLNAPKALEETFDKISELLVAIESKTPPSMDSKFIKTMDFGKPKCPNCPYREVCRRS